MNVAELLANAATAFPRRTAVVWGADWQHRRSYGEVARRAAALAHHLRHDLGLDSGDRVAVLMDNGPELVEAMFGVWWAGCAVAPVNARSTAAELRYHVEDAGARAILVGAGHDATVDEVLPEVPSLQHALRVAPPDGVEDASFGEVTSRATVMTPAPAAPDDPAWLVYTSGTTGRAKAAVLTHRVLTFVALAWVADLHQLCEDDVGLHSAPLTHGAGLHMLALTMKAVPQVVLAPRGFDPARFCEAVQRHRVTNTWLVPTQIKMLLGADLESFDLSSLRGIVYGGSPMYVEDLVAALDRIGPVLVQVFAQAESPMTGTWLPAGEHDPSGSGRLRLSSAGRARSGMRVRIVDPDGRPLPPGDVGEICLQGGAVMAGYWNRPEATAEALRDGWLHTGDVGRLDDNGYLYVLDRLKDMVISGGLNVYPREVEEALLEHPGVGQVAVIGVPDATWGEAVKAVVVPADPAAPPTFEDLITFLRDRLAGYKRPKSVDVVAALPVSPYGKVDKKALRAPYWRDRERMVS